jgi:hypothetical protein
MIGDEEGHAMVETWIKVCCGCGKSQGNNAPEDLEAP